MCVLFSIDLVIVFVIVKFPFCFDPLWLSTSAVVTLRRHRYYYYPSAYYYTCASVRE